MEEKEYPFAFSVVMAVYNVEPFLREAVDSLIAQDFGFENIQLIMVDDGSTDGSEAICDEYAEQYADNILAIHKENGGVSSARNEGLKHIQGRYINFMDADDMFTERTMSIVYDFFMKHEDETDVVALPIVFFDGQTGQHMLNNKFSKGSRVIDLYKEYSMIQGSMASAFFSHATVSDLHLDERLAYSEDTKYIVEVLLSKGTLGVINRGGVQYKYRRRTAGAASALQSSAQTPEYYLPVVSFFHKEIIQHCLDTLGYVPKFVQFTLAYELQWRFKQEHIPSNVLSMEERNEYCTALFSLLRHIDDDVILAQRYIWQENKLFMLAKKHNTQPTWVTRRNNILLCFQNTVFFELSRCQLCLEFLKIEQGILDVEGYTLVFSSLAESIKVQLEVNGEVYPCSMAKRKGDKYVLDEKALSTYGFKASVPLLNTDEEYCIRFFVVIGETQVENRNLRFGKFFPLSDSYRSAYYYKDGWKVTTRAKCLFVNRCGRRGWLKSEFAFCRELWNKNRLGGRKAVFSRIAYHILKHFKRKKIWLISDRLAKADDNGEAFWRYVQAEHKKEIKAYFVLRRDSADYKSLKEKGPLVPALSFRHKLLHLLCDCNISSQADEITSNPFAGYHDPYRNILVNNKYVFLQHGVIKDDLSEWLNRYSKNMSGFVTTASREYDSIVNGEYYYDKKTIWLTGLPRFDLLHHNEQKCITIMPTWRMYLGEKVDRQTGIWKLRQGFLESDFYLFYNRLLNHDTLLCAAQEYGYMFQFMPHPTLQPHISLFDQNDTVHFLILDAKYREVYAESSLIVTDYSSACFDFAYLRKPIIYCQFDKEKFFSGVHVYKRGYFDYEQDGFGEVEYTLEGTVNRIIEYMRDGCRLKDQYRERIDGFFAFDDQNNCKRVYEKIMEMEKQG